MNTIVSSKDARAQFAEILNQVMYAGREFIISRFDKPIAKITPIQSASEDKDMTKRKNVISKIVSMRKVFQTVDLTKIVIREREKEYRRWKKFS